MGAGAFYADYIRAGNSENNAGIAAKENQAVFGGMYEVINAIIAAVSQALNAEFGDAYAIYTEQIAQGLQEPCFFVACVNPTNRLFLDKRYFRENQFCLQYFPADTARAREECNAVAERLYWCLEHISVAGDLTRGSQMRYEVVDDVLSFFVNYDMFVYRLDNTPAMGELAEKVNMKG